VSRQLRAVSAAVLWFWTLRCLEAEFHEAADGFRARGFRGGLSGDPAVEDSELGGWNTHGYGGRIDGRPAYFLSNVRYWAHNFLTLEIANRRGACNTRDGSNHRATLEQSRNGYARPYHTSNPGRDHPGCG